MGSRRLVLAACVGVVIAASITAAGCSNLPAIPADDGGAGGRAGGAGGRDATAGGGRGGQAGGGAGVGGAVSGGDGGGGTGVGGAGGVAGSGAGGAAGTSGSGGRGGGAAGASGGGGRGGGAAGASGGGGRGGGAAGTTGGGGRGGGVAGTIGGGGRGGGAGGTGGGSTAPNGSACARAGDCGSGQCVDGRCCNTACNGQCEACDVASREGTCSPVPSGPPHGARTSCAGTGVCGGQCGGAGVTACAYPAATTSCRSQTCVGNSVTQAAGCDGSGACPPAVSMSCAMGCSGTECLGACTTDAECRRSVRERPYCDTGTCTERLPNGRACALPGDCTSNRCVDGFCCNEDCTAQCASCKEPGWVGVCVPVDGAPRTGGTPARVDCAGTGACTGRCNGQSTSCQYPASDTACGSASCTAGTLTPVGGCDSAGACVQQPTPCVTGYCNTITTCGSCPAGDSCGAGRWCFSGTCGPKRQNGQACAADGECTSAHCVSDGQGGRSCCPTACGANGVCYQAACCVVNTACDTSCRSSTCVRGCGLPDIPRNCGCTSTSCCGNVCCSGPCDNGTCNGSMTSCNP